MVFWYFYLHVQSKIIWRKNLSRVDFPYTISFWIAPNIHIEKDQNILNEMKIKV